MWDFWRRVLGTGKGKRLSAEGAEKAIVLYLSVNSTVPRFCVDDDVSSNTVIVGAVAVQDHAFAHAFDVSDSVERALFINDGVTGCWAGLTAEGNEHHSHCVYLHHIAPYCALPELSAIPSSTVFWIAPLRHCAI